MRCTKKYIVAICRSSQTHICYEEKVFFLYIALQGPEYTVAQEAGGVALWPLAFATVASCLLEAATTQLDNIFLPLHHLAMLAA